MIRFVSEEAIIETIDFFRKKDYKKPEQIGLYFYFKAMGINNLNYSAYPKWGNMDDFQKAQALRILYDLAGIFDASTETGLKRTALFVFSIRKHYKQNAFYNGATPFQRLGSRITDTLDNALISTLLQRSATSEDSIMLRSDSIDTLIEKYLVGDRIPIELMAAWYHRFWKIHVPDNISEKDFSDICVLNLLNQLHLTAKDFERLFYYQDKIVNHSSNMISGEWLRKMLNFGDDIAPEILKEPSDNYMQIEKSISLKEAEKLLEERGSQLLSEERIKGILENRDAININNNQLQKELAEIESRNDDEYVRAAKVIRKHLLETSFHCEITNEQITDFLVQFREKFSPEALNKLTDQNIRQKMFYTKEQTNDSLCYWLEFNSFSREAFGSIAGGSSYKFGLFQRKEDGVWISGTPQNTQELSEEESLEKAYSIRDKLVRGAEIIKGRSISSVNDYRALERDLKENIGDFYNYFWVMKYFFMMYPDKFSGFYTEGWQKHVLFALGIKPDKSFFVRNGQIALAVKHTDLPTPVFGKAFFDKFGYILQFVRVGTSNEGGKSHFEEWCKKGIVAIGWNKTGTLDDYSTGLSLNKTAVKEKLQEMYYPKDKRLASRKAGEIATFYSTDENTVFVAMDGEKLLALGNNVGDYQYNDNYSFAHQKPVEWNKCFSINEKLPNKSEGYMTSCKQLSNEENIMYLYHKYYYDNEYRTDEYSLALHERQESFMTKQIIRKPRKNQLHPLNQIIYGAPGTGKTYNAVEYAIAIVENRPVDISKSTEKERQVLMEKYKSLVAQGRITFTTFHQSYGYEEFIQGIRPDSKSNTINFIKSDGVFKRIADKAMNDFNNNYVIIIDEINRGNISKIFGELITLIEDDKRCGELNELTVTLPMGDTFAVPNNLYIVGTMNSADKSISLIDTALRRRFEFVEMPPNEDLVDNDELRSVLIKLNGYLRKELRSTDLLIGHAYFIRKEIGDLGNIMNRSIIPLLYEYFYDDEAKVKKALDCIRDTCFEIDTGYKGRIRIRKKG